MIRQKIESFLESLPLGALLRKLVDIVLWVAAGILLFAGLFYIIDLIMSLPGAKHPAIVLGTFLAVLIACAGISLALLILYYRTREIANFQSPSYPVIYLGTQLLRLAGEILAVFHLVTGLSAGIMFWFGSYPRLPYFDSLMWRILNFASFPPFLSGLFTILACIFQAVLTLVASYFLAEFFLLIRDIGQKNRR